MEYPILNNGVQRLLKLSSILIFLGATIVIIFGYSIKSINIEVKDVQKFVDSSSNLQTNFEKSLQIYVEQTREITKFLLAIRPSNEEGYIKFISEVEQVGKDLSLDLNLQYLNPKSKTATADIKALDYQVTFYGNQNDLMKFLESIEKLQYYVNIKDISFTNPGLISEEEAANRGNIKVIISLYIK